MPEKCESGSYTRDATPPRITSPPNQQSVWRSTMHLKPYPKLVKSELRLEPGGIQGPAQRGSLHVSQQGALLRADWGVRQACITRGVSIAPSSNNNHGNVGGVGSGGRYPFSVISTNTLRRSNPINNNSSNVNNLNNSGGSHRLSHQGEFYTTWARKAKISSSTTSSSTTPTFTSSLVLLSSSTSTGSENDGSLSLYQSGGEDGEGPLDIWAVIKPGNTKEKIAIFASASGRTNSSSDSDCSNGSLNGNLNSHGGSNGGDSAPETECPSPPAVAVLSRSVSMKVKGSWEGECTVAKRRRRSGNGHHHHHHHNHHHLQDQRTKEPQQQGHKPAEVTPAQVALSQPPQVPEGGVTGDESPEVGEEGGKTVSVVEMVAFLEQRANEQQQLDSKPIVSLQRSSTSITLSKAPGGSVPAPLVTDQPREGSESRPAVGEEEGESVRVSDMVAKLESECLKRRSVGGGDLSRNNSLRRTVGRVLLAGADACSVSAQPPSPSSSSPSSLLDIQSQGRLEKALSVSSIVSPASPTDKHRNECVSQASVPASPPSPAPVSPNVVANCEAAVQAREAVERSVEAGGKCLGLRQMESSTGEPEQQLTPTESPQTQIQCHSQSHVHLKLQSPCEPKPRLQPHQPSTDSPSQAELKEPLPGMLFFSQLFKPSASESHKLSHLHTAQTHTSMHSTHPPQPATDSELCLISNLEAVDSPPLLLLPESPSYMENSENKREKTSIKEDRGEEVELEEDSSLVPFPLRRMVSHEFLEMRFKIQLLLEPQQYLAFLPDHIVVKIFSLLPTQSLAALKCTCHYFKFIIENYGVRPADSRWVCDSRYKDDPCKQCKKRYGRGDVSLCRWHHKPYCQAMPYGPGYWMCCHGSHKDTAGCNVGLHDNRWVPAFHSINMPIYKRNRDSEEEVEAR